MMRTTFDILLLLARPAAGKSEIIDYLRRTDLDERRRRFHIGRFEEVDDFPMLWAWFEEDAILSQMGYPRLHSDEDGYFKYPYLWHVLIRRLALEVEKRERDHAAGEEVTTIVEFSRGGEHGGYRAALQYLPIDLLRRAAICYVNVSYAESLRKNRRRLNPQRPDSILEHALPDAKLERLYRQDDWAELSAVDPAWVAVDGLRVPYVVLENEDDVTSGRGEPLGERLEQALGRLWELL